MAGARQAARLRPAAACGLLGGRGGNRLSKATCNNNMIT